METRKVLSSLSYFSVFFAGLLFPLVVFFVTEDKDTKSHAKKAFLSHLIPVIPVPFAIYSLIAQFGSEATDIPFLFICSVAIVILLSLIVAVWNIIKGITVLTE